MIDHVRVKSQNHAFINNERITVRGERARQLGGRDDESAIWGCTPIDCGDRRA